MAGILTRTVRRPLLATTSGDPDMDDLNPHQFGEQGILFQAPLGQPERGTFKGNPAARLYRAVQVPGHVAEDGPERILEHINGRHTDRGHDTNMGIHWQHDLPTAQDYASHLETTGRHSDHGGVSVILEADHPGHEHVVDDTPVTRVERLRGKPMLTDDGPPEGVYAGRPGNNRLTGYKKDWALIADTVGPHNMNAAMLAEVPIRPGAPMRVSALHTPNPEKLGDFVRNPVQFKGTA